MGATVADVKAMIPTLLLPFNAIKAVLNVGLVLLLYKHIGNALRKAGFLPRKALSLALAENDGTVAAQTSQRPAFWRTVIVTASAAVLIAVSLVIIFVVLGGKFDFGV